MSAVRRLVLLLPCVVAVIALGAYAFRAPERTHAELRRALSAGDERALEELVDFAALRESMKRELLDLVTRGTDDEALALAQSRYIGSVVDGLVQPQSLKSFGGAPAGGEATLRWRGPSAFVVESEAATLRFERRGLSFVLTGIELPDELAERIRAAAKKARSDEDPAVRESAARACHAWRKNAQRDLQLILTEQRAFHAEHKRYASGLDELAFSRPPGPEVYDYVVVAAQPGALVLEARGKGVMEGDRLRLDDGGLRIVEDRCRP